MELLEYDRVGLDDTLRGDFHPTVGVDEIPITEAPRWHQNAIALRAVASDDSVAREIFIKFGHDGAYFMSVGNVPMFDDSVRGHDSRHLLILQ